MNPLVRISNRTSREEEIGKWLLPSHGRLTITFREYIELAKTVDLTSLPVKIDFPKFRPRNKASEHGIFGDGVTECTVKLQSLVDDLAEWGGGQVLLDTGVYLVSHIDVHGGVRLVGCGGGTVLKSVKSAHAAFISLLSGDCGVEHMCVANGGNVSQAAIYRTDGADDAIVEHVYIEGFEEE